VQVKIIIEYSKGVEKLLLSLLLFG